MNAESVKARLKNRSRETDEAACRFFRENSLCGKSNYY